MLTRVQVVLILLMQAAMPAYAAEQTIEFDANESPPFWSQSMPGNGMCGEIVLAISEKAGLPHHINFKPLQRMIEDDSNNDLGNPQFFMVNQEFGAIIPICLYEAAFFYYAPNLKEEMSIKSLKDLKGLRIGALKGTIVDRSLFNQSGITFEESYSREALFKKLKLGRIDLCLVIDVIGYQTIKKLFPVQFGDFISIPIHESTAPLAILIDEKYPQAERIGVKYREALREIIENGKYLQILEKYYGSDQVPDNWFDKLHRFERLYQSNDDGLYE